MKLSELEEGTEEDDVDEVDDELVEAQSNLSEALGVVESCQAVIAVLMNPNLMDLYLAKEVRRVQAEATSLLQQYDYPIIDISEEEEE